MAQDFFQSKTYQNFLHKLESLEAELPQAPTETANAKILDNYWNWGKTIHELGERAPSGQKKKLMKTLGEHFQKDLRLLFQFQKFYNSFPKGLDKIDNLDRLTWAHLRAVLSLNSEKEKLFYLREAAEDATPSRRLEIAVRHNLYAAVHQSTKKHPHGKLARPTAPLYNYQGKLVDVLDGDTLRVVVEQGFFTQQRLELRLHGINA